MGKYNDGWLKLTLVRLFNVSR